MKKYKVGYTTGVFDMFHIGHLNILQKAKTLCDYLIVGISTDELVQEYKNKKPVIPYEDRKRIVEAIRFVDETIPQISMNKLEAWEQHPFDVIFVGDDWKGSDKWNALEEQFRKVGVDIVYFPYTKDISSSYLRPIADEKVEDYL